MAKQKFCSCISLLPWLILLFSHFYFHVVHRDRNGSISDLEDPPIIMESSQIMVEELPAPANFTDLPCNISALSSDANSAVLRAKTSQCRQQIIDAACASQRGDLYDLRPLQRTCSAQPSAKQGTYYGCFYDNPMKRDVLGSFRFFPTSNSPKTCINHCIRAGYPYAAVQYSTECFCGAEFGRYGQAPEELCSSKCPEQWNATAEEHCGGISVQNVYGTGVEQLPSRFPAYVNPAPSMARARIVYLMTLNGRNYRQVVRLFRRIYQADHFYLIHVDGRAEYLYRKLQFLQSRFANVRFTAERIKVNWGGVTLLEMLLMGMRELITGALSHWQWSYLINLSESDYPIKTDAELAVFLAESEPLNFIAGPPDGDGFASGYMDYTYVECDGHLFRVDSRPPLQGVRAWGGADWFAFHYHFVHYVISALDGRSANEADSRLLKTLYSYFQRTMIPSESFFHFVLVNSRFCSSAVLSNNLRHISWGQRACSCRVNVDGCGCSPRAIRNYEMPELLASLQHSPTYFARKFDSVEDIGPLSRLDMLLDSANRQFDNAMNFHSVQSTRPVAGEAEPIWFSFFHHNDSMNLDSVLPFNPNANVSDDANNVQIASRYDTQVTVTETMMRLAARKLGLRGKTPRELTLYKHSGISLSSVSQALLIRFEALANSKQLQVEALFSFSVPTEDLNPPFPVGSEAQRCMARLESLTSGSELDYKQLLFRGTPGVMGVLSDLKFVHRWRESSLNCSFRFVLFDPTKEPRHSEVVDVPWTQETALYEADLDKPHLPGVWTLVVMLAEEHAVPALAYHFLVTPHLVFNGVQLSVAEHLANGTLRRTISRINSGPSGIAPNALLSAYADLLSDNRVRTIKRENALRNGLLRGQDLQRWALALYDTAFTFRAACVSLPGIDGQPVVDDSSTSLQRCELTTWSSLSPDENLDIGEVNPKTGRLC